MRRLYFLIPLVVCGLGATAQPYNNEWIDPAKTYFKFPIRTSQLCRIPRATLVSYGLGDVPAEQFQLWRDGQEVPMYTTEATGPLSATGYLEFFGKMNDGLKDSVLYPEKWYQPNASRSLFSDTSWYFLTINPAGPNKRLVQTANNVASTTLPADSFFHFKGEMLFPQGFSEGYCIPYEFNESVPYSGLPVRSSVFDKGEGWYYSEFRKSAPGTVNLNNLRLYSKAAGITIEYKAAGFKGSTRNVMLFMNDSLLSTNKIISFDMINPVISNVPLSRVTNLNSTSFRFTTDLDDKFSWDPDRNVLQSIVLSYERTFNLNALTQYEFKLVSNSAGNHLRIANFSNSGLSAILYDFTNGRRYLSVNKADSSLFLLEPSAAERKIAILNQHSSRTTTISTFKTIHFPDLTQTANQGDYLIVSSKVLTDYNGINFVEAYRSYRSSFSGGAYKAVIYDIDELADMFSFGIRKHPLAVKNFVRFAHNQFITDPKYVFLIGHGSRYVDYRNSNYPLKDWLNIVPTYGMPASDNMLVSDDNFNATPLIPVGRLSAVNGKEIGDYLSKVKELEALDNLAARTPENKEWKKNILQLVGGDDEFLSKVILNFMNVYKDLVKDTLMGANVNTYERTNNDHYASDILEITNKINHGVGLITYFGHSSSSSIDYSLNGPEEFNNTGGRYPVFIANGCRAGNLFDFDGNRTLYYGQTISDKFVFAPKLGAIGFISNTDIGILNYMHLYTTEWYRSAGQTKYGKSLGEIQQTSIQKTLDITGHQDFFNRQNCEQILLHGDPAIVLNPTSKPDYAASDSFISVQPLHATVAEDTLLIQVKFINLGKAVTDSVWAEIKREYPDGREVTIAKTLFRNLYQKDSMVVKVPVKGVFDEGTNYIVAIIDPLNEWEEMTKVNNTARIPFEISNYEIRPVYPYPFAILNEPGFLLTGSTVNAVEEQRTYRLQIDTTENFNSPALFQKDTLTIGGAVSFDPSISWSNNTVYYWRLAPVINGQPVNWKNSSFQYLQGSFPGWGQSHFFQHKKSNYSGTQLNDNRIIGFNNKIQSLYIVNSIYGFSGGEDNHFSITVNGDQTIRSACVGRSIIFNVFDTLTFKPWDNSIGNRFGSGPNCDYYRRLNFEFSYVGSANRKKMMDFLDSIPTGFYVTARMILDGDYWDRNGLPYFDSSFVKYWQRDTLIFGPGKSLYHSLLKQGFYTIDSINIQPKTFIFVFKKDDSSRFKPVTRVSQGLLDRIYSSIFPETIDSLGTITSPIFGPAKTWKEMHWMGHQYPGINPESEALVELIGIDKDSNQTLLKIFSPSQWVNDISNINAAQYPYLQLRLKTKNAVKAIPYQLDYWRLFYEPVPDGALSARDHYVFSGPILLTAKDSLKIALAFKNISKTPLAPTNVVVKIGDRNGIIGTYPLNQLKALASQDTAIISFKKETNGMTGKYYALIEVNKEQNPLEQFTFNNSTYLPFEVVTSLPTSVINFNAIAENNNSSLLTWNVTNEQDVKTYVLEHGTTTSNLTFLKEMAAKNINTTSNYSWVHTKPVIGVNYYRLKTIYTSGNIEYAPIRKVVFSKNGSINIYPNPFRDKIWVTVTGNKQWNMELYNASGQIIMTKKGAGNQSINTQSLPAGLYLARISCDGEIQSMKLEKHSQ